MHRKQLALRILWDQASVTKSKGVGATYGVSGVWATDPQGTQALVVSYGLSATVGTPGVSGGIQIGSATYQSVQGFSGLSFGYEGSGGQVLNVGGGINTNSSGVATYANVGLAIGDNFDVSKTMSNGVFVIPVCSK